MPKPAKEQRHNVEAWKAAVDNANAQVEHQRNRARALELMSLYVNAGFLKKQTNFMEDTSATRILPNSFWPSSLSLSLSLSL